MIRSYSDKQVKEASDKAPENHNIRYHLGMAYFKKGDKELAKQELKKALELDPGFSGADEAKSILQNLK